MSLSALLTQTAVMAVMGISAATEIRRGPHHPRESPLPPGAKHYKPSQTLTKLTDDKDLIRDVTHLEEDIGRPLQDMSNEELEFHYFKLHDFDSNTLLDGLELLKAVYHTMDHEHGESEVEQSPPTEEEMNRLIELVDKVLEEDDVDKDGFISYPEFAMSKIEGRSIDLVTKPS